MGGHKLLNRNVEIKAKPRPRPLKAVCFEPSVALRNYDCVNHGVLTLRELLAQSTQIPANLQFDAQEQYLRSASNEGGVMAQMTNNVSSGTLNSSL